MKILVCTDCHIGVKRYGKPNIQTQIHSRIEDTIKSLTTFCNIAIEQKADAVFILGDVFNTKTPSNVERDLFIEALGPILGKLDSYLIPGNHDKESLSHALSNLKILGKANKLHIIDKPEIINLQGYNFIFLPFQTDSSMVQYIDSVKDTPNSILLGHFLTNNCVYSNNYKPELNEDVVPVSLLENSKFILSLSGHIHKRQILGNRHQIHYIGSLVKWDWSERNENKGCVVLDLEKDKEPSLKFIEIPDRRFVEIDYEDVDSFVRQDNLSEVVVKVVGKCKASERRNIDLLDIKKKLSQKCFKVEGVDIEFERAIASVDAKTNMFTPVLPIQETLVQWKKNNNLTDDFVLRGLELIGEESTK